MRNLEVGNKFNEHGIWYEVLKNVIAVESDVALVEAEADDGFKSYHVFEKVQGFWKSTGNSVDLDMAEEVFQNTIHYRNSK